MKNIVRIANKKIIIIVILIMIVIIINLIIIMVMKVKMGNRIKKPYWSRIVWKVEKSKFQIFKC